MRCCLEMKMIKIKLNIIFVVFFTYFVNDCIHHDCLVGTLLLMNVECILLNSLNYFYIARIHRINQIITMIK